MKAKITPFALALLMGAFILPACQKNLQLDATDETPVEVPVAVTDTSTAIPYPLQASHNCGGAPKYADTILFTQPSNTDYIVMPVNNPDSGDYFAWPEGMVIDQHTGAINLSKSDGGLRYNIGWVKKGTTDTCLQSIVLGGASYADSIYVLEDDQRYAKPYYNADPNNTVMCTSQGGPNTCAYDVNNAATNQQIKIDKNNGYIDLKNTANGLAFGLVPVNGAVVNTTIAHRLNDQSMMATQYLPVTLVYYARKSDIPPGLVSLITQKLNNILNEVLLINLFNPHSAVASSRPRPPVIVVTRYN